MRLRPWCGASTRGSRQAGVAAMAALAGWAAAAARYSIRRSWCILRSSRNRYSPCRHWRRRRTLSRHTHSHTRSGGCAAVADRLHMDALLQLEGSQAQPLRYLALRNLSWAHTAWAMPPPPQPADFQARTRPCPFQPRPTSWNTCLTLATDPCCRPLLWPPGRRLAAARPAPNDFASPSERTE